VTRLGDKGGEGEVCSVRRLEPDALLPDSNLIAVRNHHIVNDSRSVEVGTIDLRPFRSVSRKYWLIDRSRPGLR
jgi:hypothetical protein